MVPGVTTAPVFVAAIAYCENRKDLMLIADTPILLEPLAIDDCGLTIGAASGRLTIICGSERF